MNVYNMTQESIPAVAELMCTMKPECLRRRVYNIRKY